jgi:nucleoside-diphosphate-sugar epimerase
MTKDSTLPPEMDPGRYIEKVSLVTGEILDHPILPRHLLVSHHRDYHIVDVHARRMMSKIVRESGSEEEARRRMRERRRLGYRASEVVARAIGEEDVTKVSKALFGLKEKEYYFRYKRLPYDRKEIARRLEEMRAETEHRLEATRRDGRLRLRVLLTGGTGFVGKEVLWQAAHDPEIVEMIVLIRPKVVRDRKTGAILETLSPAERGIGLLRQLWLDTSERQSKFRFVAGDVEQPNLGLDAADLDQIGSTVTHVIHCAASVAFDDPYPTSFRANVLGTVNALRFSAGLQARAEGPFVAHQSIETSYIHGRQVKKIAREDEMVFPRNFYNNYYELTKAMASIETERFMLDKGLRVTQLCPAIVIGDQKTGNNRGDTKVVNAPVNLFGRAQEAIDKMSGSWIDRSKASMLARMATVFPGDPSAEMNLIPVDRVAAGMIAALRKPAAIGERIHLATDNRITSSQMLRIIEEELGVRVRLAEPTLHRTITLPAMTRVLRTVNQEKIGQILEKLSTIFGGYSEWGQPVHEVGNDVHLLDLALPRPDSRHAFRMLCRHNRYVQEFGKVKDLDEISRREREWQAFVDSLERSLDRPVGAVPATEFEAALATWFDLESFRCRKPQDSVPFSA